MGNTLAFQLPGRQLRALRARSCLIHIDKHLLALARRPIDGREGAAPINKGQPSRVAVRQDAGAVADQLCAMPANRCPCLGVLVCQFVGRLYRGLAGRLHASGAQDRLSHSPDRIEQVLCRRARLAQCLRSLLYIIHESRAVGRLQRHLRHTIARSGADRPRPPNDHRADRHGCIPMCGTVGDLETKGDERLVDHAHDARFHPHGAIGFPVDVHLFPLWSGCRRGPRLLSLLGQEGD